MRGLEEDASVSTQAVPQVFKDTLCLQLHPERHVVEMCNLKQSGDACVGFIANGGKNVKNTLFKHTSFCPQVVHHGNSIMLLLTGEIHKDELLSFCPC